ncbi:MAG: DUF3866 family protein [Peptococcaceae bacterium]|nr:DUF3866 family protein [Peptococcaceae bacterium]
MIRFRQGKVHAVIAERPGVTEIIVSTEGQKRKAINYNELTGPVAVGDSVVLNTTAVHLGLGTGGFDFVMANFNNQAGDAGGAGHIMKLRYTPSQVKVLAAEEDQSPYGNTLKRCQSLAGIPVIIGTLHSMVGPSVATIKYLCPQLRIAYLMTDGAALPIAFSKLISELKQKRLLEATITCGHAFGGDFEAVNAYSGLLVARVAARADIIVAAMGPGIVGTGSTFGHSAVEQGELVNAVNILGGKPIAIPRLGFSDTRSRHQGVSHHTLTALGRVALTPATIPIPNLEKERQAFIMRQLDDAGITRKHEVVFAEGEAVVDALRHFELKVTTMGRGVDEERAFFLAAGAAASLAVNMVQK